MITFSCYACFEVSRVFLSEDDDSSPKSSEKSSPTLKIPDATSTRCYGGSVATMSAGREERVLVSVDIDQ